VFHSAGEAPRSGRLPAGDDRHLPRAVPRPVAGRRRCSARSAPRWCRRPEGCPSCRPTSRRGSRASRAGSRRPGRRRWGVRWRAARDRRERRGARRADRGRGRGPRSAGERRGRRWSTAGLMLWTAGLVDDLPAGVSRAGRRACGRRRGPRARPPAGVIEPRPTCPATTPSTRSTPSSPS
jgi:hypothetical protein